MTNHHVAKVRAAVRALGGPEGSAIAAEKSLDHLEEDYAVFAALAEVLQQAANMLGMLGGANLLRDFLPALQALQLRYAAEHDALKALVDLKVLKEGFTRSLYHLGRERDIQTYARQKPRAWARAQRVVGEAEISEPPPIPMVLYCPNCGAQHVDAAEPCPDEGCPHYGTPHGHPELWANPPHRAHLCHACGTIWRPADVATTGVAHIQTKGKADTWRNGPLAISAESKARINEALYPQHMNGRPVTTSEFYLNEDMAAAPLGGKCIAVNHGGVATFTILHKGNLKDFSAWAPMPKRRPK